MRTTISSLALMFVFMTACLDDANTSTNRQELCKTDFTGLCPGEAQQIAQDNAHADARVAEPNATDIEVSRTCRTDQSGPGEVVTCVTKVTIAATTIVLSCETVLNNDGTVFTHGCSDPTSGLGSVSTDG